MKTEEVCSFFVLKVEINRKNNNILFNGDEQVIDNNTIVAITLLIAQSDLKEKNILIDLIMNFLNR